jgi:hypothetical protein
VADPVTDPALLSKLNTPQPVNDPALLKKLDATPAPVSDPKLLQKLDTPAPVSDPALLKKLDAKPAEGNIIQRAGHAVADWWNKQPSWAEQATEYSKSGQEAYKRGGVHAMIMDNLDQGVNLAGSFAGGGIIPAVKASPIGVGIGKAFGIEEAISPGEINWAQKGKADIREALGQAARESASTRAGMEQYEKQLIRLPPNEQLDLLGYMQGRSKGAKISDPVLQPVADEFRKQMKLRDAAIQRSEKFHDAGLQEDYVTQYWQDPHKARAFMNRWISKQGSSGYLKQKKHPTIAEGIQAGLTPKTTNLFEIAMHYVTNTDKHLNLNEMLSAGKQDGYIKYFRKGSERVPDGWLPLNGHLVEKQTPKGTMVGHAPAGWAKIWNNYVSQGFHAHDFGGKAYDTFRFASNIASQAVLSLSGYHAFTITMSAIGSEYSRAISQVIGGLKTTAKGGWQRDAKEILRGTKLAGEGLARIPTAPAAPVTTYLKGKKAQQVYLGRAPGVPDFRHIVDVATRAGGRFVGKSHAPDYQFSSAGSYFSALRRGSLKLELRDAMKHIKEAPIPALETGRKTVEAIGRAMDTISDPLFKEYIPAVKAGTVTEELGSWIKANPLSTPEEQMVMGRKIVDSVDDRYGEMIQDNVFWHTLAKQSATLAMLSYSWNFGLGRTYIGGPIKAATTGGKAFDITSEKFDPRVPFVLGYVLANATAAGVYQYMKTGKPPESAEDLVLPQTGGHVPGWGGGAPVTERAILPGHIKDAFGWWYNVVGAYSSQTPGAASQEAYNKLNPLFRMGVDLARRKDWADQPFVRPDPTVPQWLFDYFNHFVSDLEPISGERFLRGEKRGSGMGIGEEVSGIRQAPSWAQDPKGYQAWRRYKETKDWQKVKKGEERQKQLYGGTEQ